MSTEIEQYHKQLWQVIQKVEKKELKDIMTLFFIGNFSLSFIKTLRPAYKKTRSRMSQEIKAELRRQNILDNPVIYSKKIALQTLK